MVSGATQTYLDNLSRMQTEMETVQRQISSGSRVNLASDAPFSVGSLLQAQTNIGQLQQSQANLGQAQVELQSGDAALQQAIDAVTSAVTLATQASSTLRNGAAVSNALQQAQAIQQTLVNLSATSAGGRYIFSGDYDQQAMYQLNAGQPQGVLQLTPAVSTRVVTDASGAQVWLGKTAQEIFDARNADNTPAAGNVFAAIQSLITALQNNDSAGAQSSVGALKSAGDHLNQKLAYYGVGENNISNALDSASKALVAQQQRLSQLRDTDMAGAAVEMTQLSQQEQAALASRAKFGQMSLFDYLA